MLTDDEVRRIANRKHRRNYMAKHRAEYNAWAREYRKTSEVRQGIERGNKKRYEERLKDLSREMPGGGLTYGQWRERLEPLVEARRNGATYRELYRMDSAFVRRYLHVIREIANGVPVPKFIPGVTRGTREVKLEPWTESKWERELRGRIDALVEAIRSGKSPWVVDSSLMSGYSDDIRAIAAGRMSVDELVGKKKEKKIARDQLLWKCHEKKRVQATGRRMWVGAAFQIATLHTNDTRNVKDNRPFKTRISEVVGYLVEVPGAKSGELRGLFPRMSEYYALARAVAAGTEPMPEKAPSRQWLRDRGYAKALKPENHEPVDFAEWSRRAGRLVAMVRDKAPAPEIQRADNIVYKGWIGTIRRIAANEIGFPKSEIPPRDAEKRQRRRSCVTYGQWSKRVRDLADLYASGATGRECRKSDSSIWDGWRKTVEDVAGGAPIPPEDKWPKASWALPPAKKRTYDEWRAAIIELAEMVMDDSPRKIRQGFMRHVWTTYRSEIHRVAAGGLVPFEVHDDWADGTALGGGK